MKEFKTSMEEKGSFYASKNLFPSFVLEIESQSPAFLFSPPFLTRSFSCTYIYLYSSDPWIKLHPEGWVRRSRNEAKGRPQGRFVSFVSVTVVSFRYVLLPFYFFPFFFLSLFFISERDYFSTIINDHL